LLDSLQQEMNGKFRFLFLLVLTRQAYTQIGCKGIIYQGKEYDIMEQKPMNDMCEGRMHTLKRVEDEAMFCVALDDPKSDTPHLKDALCTKTDCNCGTSVGEENAESRIEGGATAPKNTYTWLAYIKKTVTISGVEQKSTCAGAIVSQWHIVTSSLCCSDKMNRTLTLKYAVGMYDRSQTKDEDYKTANYTLYPDQHLCVIRTEYKMNIGKKMKPVCLPEKDEDLSGTEGIIVGWGLDKYVSDWLITNKMVEGTDISDLWKHYNNESTLDEAGLKKEAKQVEAGLNDKFKGISEFINFEDFSFKQTTEDAAKKIADIIKKKIEEKIKGNKDLEKEFEESYSKMINPTSAGLKSHNNLDIKERINNFENAIFPLMPAEYAPNKPKHASVKILSSSECKAAMEKQRIKELNLPEWKDGVLCAKRAAGESLKTGEICYGDIGGPLLVKKGKSFILAGIASIIYNESHEKLLPSCRCSCDFDVNSVFVDITAFSTLNELKLYPLVTNELIEQCPRHEEDMPEKKNE